MSTSRILCIKAARHSVFQCWNFQTDVWTSDDFKSENYSIVWNFRWMVQLRPGHLAIMILTRKSFQALSLDFNET